MMIKEVAEEVGVHPSTVSRAVASKYAHTPQGVLELRSFFSESVNGPEGGAMSLLTLEAPRQENDRGRRLDQAAHRRSDRQKARRQRHPRHAPHRGEISRRHAHPQYPSAPGEKLSVRRASGKHKAPARHDLPAHRESRQLVILTGLSGSGKSTVLHAFEDMGFYCVDNLPVELIPIFAELHAAGEGGFARAALLVDAREGDSARRNCPPLLEASSPPSSHRHRFHRSRRRRSAPPLQRDPPSAPVGKTSQRPRKPRATNAS